MKCSNCGFSNIEFSKFCQNCGEKLEGNEINDLNTKKSVTNKYVKLIDDEVTDYVFEPKRNNNSTAAFWLIGIFIVITGFFVFLSSSAEDISVPEVDSLDESTIETPSSFPISLLSIENVDSEWIGNVLYLKGTLRNRSSSAAKDIEVRVDFTQNENGTGLFDTRYITLTAVASNGAYTFSEPVYIDPPFETWWYNMQVETASYK